MTDFVADFVTDFCIFMSFTSVGKSFGVTYALCCSVRWAPQVNSVTRKECFVTCS